MTLFTVGAYFRDRYGSGVFFLNTGCISASWGRSQDNLRVAREVAEIIARDKTAEGLGPWQVYET